MSTSEQDGTTKEGSMEWMYKPSSMVNREDYLLGRSIDKSFQLLEAAEQGGEFNYANEVEKDLTPISIFAPTRSGPVDVIQKIKEDPLYQIQKKEEENLKQLLKNPVRMKQMREITEQQRRLSSSSTKKKSKKKGKKHQKRKRDEKSDSNNSSEDDAKSLSLNKIKSSVDIDKLISEKLKFLKKTKFSSSESDSSESEKQQKEASTKHHNSNYSRDDRHSWRFDGRRSPQRQQHYPSKHQPHFDRGHERQTRREEQERVEKKPRSRSRSKDRHHRKEMDCASTSRPSPNNFRLPNLTRARPPAEKRKPIDEAEAEKKRMEMMSNAKWRDEQRTKNVTKYREEEKKEEEKKEKERRGHDPDFIRKQLLEAANTGSVEKRIKSNSYNIQKSSSAMNQNFARR